MKKKLITMLLAATFITAVPAQTFAASLPAVQKPAISIDMIVDGKKVTLPDTEPYIDAKGNTMVPIRFVSEKLGAEVLWNNKEQIVTINMNGKQIKMKIGSKTATVNGTTIQLSAPAAKKEGRTVVPLRFVSENLGADVKWDKGSYAINITSDTYQKKVDRGEVTLNMYGREIAKTQPTNKWLYLSDTEKWVYDLPNRMILGAGSNVTALENMDDPNFNKNGLDSLATNIKEFYKVALNVDYRTINSKAYADQVYGLLQHGYRNDSAIDKFVKDIKANKVVVEGYAFPDMSTARIVNGALVIRTQFKFRVVSGANPNFFGLDSWNVSEMSTRPTFVKRGKWYVGYSDVAASTRTMNADLTNFKIASTENMFANKSHSYKELK